MGPGPSDVSPRVLSASARPTIGHLDPAFVGLMDDVKRLLQFAFQTRNELTIPLSAPGSAGMEAAFVNLLEPGDTAIVCQNGVFGGRMKENVERCGATAVMVQDRWGDPVNPEKVSAAIQANPHAKVLAFVHAETSTGVRSDAEQLCQLAKSAGMLTIVDAVTSLAGIDLQVDAGVPTSCIPARRNASVACLALRLSLLALMRSQRSLRARTRCRAGFWK